MARSSLLNGSRRCGVASAAATSLAVLALAADRGHGGTASTPAEPTPADGEADPAAAPLLVDFPVAWWYQFRLPVYTSWVSFA